MRASLLARRSLEAMLLAGASALVLSACRKTEGSVDETPCPAVVGDESDAELQTKHHAVDAFTLVQSDGACRVLSFKLPKATEADSDYCVVVYRRQGSMYVRHGAGITLVNFERPRLSMGPPPRRIETTMKPLGVRCHVAIDPQGSELILSEGIMDGGSLVGHPQAR